MADRSTGNLVEKNVIRDTRDFGVAVFSDSDSNRVETNDVQRTLQGDGINVSTDSDLTLISKNIANVNSDDGIDTDNSQTTITGNIANNTATSASRRSPARRTAAATGLGERQPGSVRRGQLLLTIGGPASYTERGRSVG